MLTMTTPAINTVKEQDMLAIQEPLKSNYGMKLKSPRSTAAKIDSAAADFEAQFVSSMLANMFSTVEANEETGGGDAEEVYQSLLINEYGKIIARTGGIGVADQVRQMMLAQQEHKEME